MPDDSVNVVDVDNRQAGIESVAKKIIDWTSDSAAGTVEQPIGHISGSILGLETNPDDSDIPTDDYDITIEDEEGYDILEGLGANRDAANTEKTVILQEITISTRQYTAHPPVQSRALTFKVAVAGNAKKGKAIVYYR